MRILHLTNKPVFPAIDGGCKAMQRNLECFKENGFTVRHLCISTEKHPFNSAEYPQYITNPESVFISTTLNPLHAFFGLLKGESYHVSRFRSVEFEHKLKEILEKEQFDILFLESLYTTPYLQVLWEFSNAKIVVRAHNVEFKLWERIASTTKNPFKKWYINRLSKQLKNYEISTLKKVDAIATISQDDSRLFSECGINVQMDCIPIAIPESIAKSNYASNSFFHLGSMNWKPNQEAVKELLHPIFPSIQKVLPQARLKLAGSFMPERLEGTNQANIELIGFVDDPEDFFRSEGIFLCPIQSGSGVRIKIVEAMNIGAPIITTAIGAEGIDSTDGIIIASNNDEFIQSALDLYHNEEKRKELGTKARQFIRDNYSIHAVAKKLNDFLRSI
jgi:polysaccharide biosynthesis protein PslH